MCRQDSFIPRLLVYGSQPKPRFYYELSAWFILLTLCFTRVSACVHTHKHTHIPTCIYALKNSTDSIKPLAPVVARSYNRLFGLSTWLEPFGRTSNHAVTVTGVCLCHTVPIFIERNHIVCLGLKRQLKAYQTGTQLTRRTRKRSTRPDKKRGLHV